MRVLFVTYATAFQNPGGGETLLWKTKEYLERLGVQVDLFDPWRTKIADYRLVHFFTWYTSSLWPQFKRDANRLVVTPVSWFPASWRHTLWSRAKQRLRDLIHGPTAYYDEKYYRVPDLFLPNSEGETVRLGRRSGVRRDRMRIVPHGVDPSFENGEPSLFRRTYGLERFILCVGRFVQAHKNQLGLIRTLKGRVEVPLVFIGSPGPGEEAYYERCRQEADGNFVFLPACPHDSPMLASAYKAAEVLVVPSFLEAPGLVALEAGLAGAKVVITREGATQEYFGDTVDYVDPRSAKSILAGVLRALARPRDARLVKRIRRHYTWDRIAEKTLEAYRSLS